MPIFTGCAIFMTVFEVIRSYHTHLYTLDECKAVLRDIIFSTVVFSDGVIFDTQQIPLLQLRKASFFSGAIPTYGVYYRTP